MGIRMEFSTSNFFRVIWSFPLPKISLLKCSTVFDFKQIYDKGSFPQESTARDDRLSNNIWIINLNISVLMRKNAAALLNK